MDFINLNDFKGDQIGSLVLLNKRNDFHWYGINYKYNSYEPWRGNLSFQTPYLELDTKKIIWPALPCDKNYFQINQSTSITTTLNSIVDRIKEVIPVAEDGSQYKFYYKNDGYGLKFKLRNKGQNITTKIFKYNISKKYMSVDEMNCMNHNDMREFVKTMYGKRDIRMIITPQIWMKKDKKMCGLIFMVDIMEIKYPNSNIQSVVDSKTINKEHIISSISI